MIVRMRHRAPGTWGRGVAAGALSLLVAASAAASVGAQSSMESAVRLLEEGQVEEGKAALVEAATVLPPSEATRVLRMAQTLGAVQRPLRPLVARAIVLSQRDSLDQALAALSEAVPAAEEQEPGDGAALLLFSARLAEDLDLPLEAQPIYARVVSEFPGSAAWPEAVLQLSRHRLETGAELDQAASDVETLIVKHPTHPLVPTARRLLTRLQEAIG